MTLSSRYLPPDSNAWQGRSDAPPGACFFQHIQSLDLLSPSAIQIQPNGVAFGIIGFQCDEGAERDLSRMGSNEGPRAIRHRLARLPLQRREHHYYDAGDISCTDHDLEASQAALAEAVAMLLKKQITPIVIGGGHELALGHFSGISATFPTDQRIGIVNFDAHFDLHSIRPSNRRSATTVFADIAHACEEENRRFDLNCVGIQHSGNFHQSFDVAHQLDANIIYAEDLHRNLKEKCYDFIDRVIDENDLIYISLSMDVFSPAFAPGVGATQPLGITPWQIIPLIRQLANSGKVIAYDICEHIPRYDIDHHTAKLAATLIYEMIHHHKI